MTSLQEDPLVVYIIVREELNMSGGKIAAQCSHAIQKLLVKYFFLQVFLASKKALPKNELKHLEMTQKWIENLSRKVILKADDKEWERLKKEFHSECFIVVDAGLTEIPANTETVMCLWPIHKSEKPKSIKKLQIL